MSLRGKWVYACECYYEFMKILMKKLWDERTMNEGVDRS